MTSHSLAKFNKEPPTQEEIRAVFQELLSEPNDRAVAVIGAGFVEKTLMFAIASKMVRLDLTEGNLLFENQGPLATFSSRIKMGYALGLYGKKRRAALDRVRHIRNAFAHVLKPITFATPAIAAICAQLSDMEPNPNDPAADIGRHNRSRYLTEICTLNLNFTGLPQHLPDQTFDPGLE